MQTEADLRHRFKTIFRFPGVFVSQDDFGRMTFISKKDLSLQVFELVVANKASKINLKYM